MTSSSTSSSTSTAAPNNSNQADPGAMLNCTVKIQNVISKPELNNQIGIVKSYNNERDRYTVQLYSAQPTSPPISLKSDNLIAASIVDKARGQLELMKSMIQFMKTNQQLHDQFWNMYNLINDVYLPNGIKPEHALGGVVLLFLIVVYVIGFSKSILFCSMVGILFAIALPDIMTIRNPYMINMDSLKLIVRNFPSRWRTTIQEQSGYQLSPRIANGLLVAILLLSTKVLITPLAKGGGGQGQGQGQGRVNVHGNGNGNGNAGAGVATTTGQSWTMEEIYKLGYEDGTKEEYGTSLPDDHEKFSFSSITSSTSSYEDYDDDYQYEPLPPTSSTTKGSKVGFGTLLSVFALFRTVKELGFVGGTTFDFNYFKTNLQSMPPMKMAFMGFMLYRVISAFL